MLRSNTEFGSAPGLSPQAIGSYQKLERALDTTIERFVATGRRVLLIGSQVDANCHFNRSRLYQGPLPHAPLKPCVAGSRQLAEAAGAQMNNLLARVQSKWPDSVQLLKPIDYLCGPSDCPTMHDGLWLYFDRTHFSVAGSRFIAQRVADSSDPFSCRIRSKTKKCAKWRRLKADDLDDAHHRGRLATTLSR